MSRSRRRATAIAAANAGESEDCVGPELEGFETSMIEKVSEGRPS
jgi:hypothetical protein